MTQTFKIGALLTLILVSCSQLELDRNILEPGSFSDSWQRDEVYTTHSICTISSSTKGGFYIAVNIQNVCKSRETGKCTLTADCTVFVFPQDFQRVLEKTRTLERTEDPIRFTIASETVEISWKMFDEIYEKYELFLQNEGTVCLK